MADLYTSIIGAGDTIASIASTSGYYLVSDEYDDGDTGDITISGADIRLEFAANGTLSQKIIWTGTEGSIEIGPGWTIDDLDVQAADLHVEIHNGATTGILSTTVAGDNVSLEGNGYGAVAERVWLTGDDCTCHSFSVDSKTPGAGLDAIVVSNGNGRARVLFMNVIDSDRYGLWFTSPDCLAFGNTIQDVDTSPIVIQTDRIRFIANRVISTSGGSHSPLYVQGDNCNILANYLNGTAASNIIAGSDNNVVAGNRAPDGITDSGTGNTLTDNNLESIDNLVGHWRARDNITTDAFGVNDWGDKSGNGNDLTQSTDGDKPAYNSSDSDFNNEASVEFDGTSEYLQTTAFSGGDATQPCTVIIVAKFDTATSSTYVFDGLNNLTLFGIGGAGGWNMNFGSVGETGTADTNAHIFVLRADTTDQKYVDGGSPQQSGNFGSNAIDGVTLGAYHVGPANFGNVKVAELRVYSDLLTDVEVNAVAQQLSGRYGITWTDI